MCKLGMLCFAQLAKNSVRFLLAKHDRLVAAH